MNTAQYIALLHTVNFRSPSWDAFIFFGWGLIALIYSFASGKGRIMSILVAVYMAELLVIQAPFLSAAVETKTKLAIYFARLLTFSALFAFFFTTLSRYVFHTAVDNRRFGSWFFSFLFSLLQVGFLISVILSFLPPDIKANFAPLVKFVFLSGTAQFVWLVLPIIYLVFVGARLSDHRVE